MIYTCDNCNYTYSADLMPGTTCPDCGSHAIRKATTEEADWYYDLLKEKMSNPLLLDKQAS